jgi:hypothetical protein
VPLKLVQEQRAQGLVFYTQKNIRERNRAYMIVYRCKVLRA